MSDTLQYAWPYDPSEGHGGPKVVKIANFKGYLHWYASNQKSNGEL